MLTLVPDGCAGGVAVGLGRGSCERLPRRLGEWRIQYGPGFQVYFQQLAIPAGK